jgi:hypothetical protein
VLEWNREMLGLGFSFPYNLLQALAQSLPGCLILFRGDRASQAVIFELKELFFEGFPRGLTSCNLRSPQKNNQHRYS